MGLPSVASFQALSLAQGARVRSLLERRSDREDIGERRKFLNSASQTLTTSFGSLRQTLAPKLLPIYWGGFPFEISWILAQI